MFIKPLVVKTMSQESTNHCTVYLNTPGILVHISGWITSCGRDSRVLSENP